MASEGHDSHFKGRFAARKSTACSTLPNRKAPRRVNDVHWIGNKKPKVLQCCYNATPSLSPQAEVFPVEDIKQACLAEGFAFEEKVALKLQDTTIEALAGCPGVKLLSKFPLKWQQVIRGEELNVTLCKEQNRDAYTVHSGAKSIAPSEPVLVMPGVYTEVDKWDKRIGDSKSHAHLWAYDIPAALLHSGYGGPDLVLHCLDQGNESRFLQDLSWFGGTNNLKTVLQWAKMEIPGSGTVCVPLVVFVAIEAIPPNTELGYDWGELLWLVLSQQEVMAQVPQSMQAYRKFVEFSNLCEQKKVALQTSSLSTPGASTSENVVQYFDAKKKRYVIEKIPASPTAEKEEAQEVKERRTWERACDKEGPPAEEAFRVIESEEELKKEFPDVHFIKKTDFETNIPQKFLDALDQHKNRSQNGGHPQLTWEEKTILDTGTMPQCRVAEITSIVHPVRYCTLPYWKAYTVVAHASIKAGTLLGEYVGVAHFPESFDEQFDNDDAAPEEQAYAFDIDVETLRSMFPLRLLKTHWKPLVIENLRTGNMARFVNCCWGMEGADKNVNTVVKIRWNQYTSRPAILLYAEADMEKGDEIIIDYGDAYWRRMAMWVQEAHFKFYKKTTEANMRLETALRSAGVSHEELRRCGKLEASGSYSPTDADYQLWRKACA